MRLGRRSSFPLLALLVLAALGGCKKTTPQQAYNRLIGEGYQLLDEEDYTGALKAFEELHLKAPENPEPYYHMACAYGRQGEVDAAFEKLETAYAMGFWYAGRCRSDSDLTALRDDPRFEELMGKMEEQARRWEEEHGAHAYRELDPDQVPAFASLESLDGHYRGREEQLEASRYLYDYRRGEEKKNRLLNEWVAALRRYRAEHPDSADSEDAALRIVEQMGKFRREWFLASWGDDGKAATAAADAYLDEYPEGVHRRKVEWMRLVSDWWSREVPAKPEEDVDEGEEGDAESRWRSYTEDRFNAFLGQLEAFRKRYPGTFEAAKALTFETWLTWDEADQQVDDRVRGLYAQLEEGYKDDEQARGYYQRWLSNLAFQIRGLDDFEGVDTAGKTWNLAAMKGKVVLIDFWATWCGPCVGEIPNLKQVYAQYKDRGFEIVGVSLDGDDRATFDQWLEENDVRWPQIYDGQGWDSALAKQYDVHGIPFTVLLDQEGRIAGVNLRGQSVAQKVADLLGGSGSDVAGN